MEQNCIVNPEFKNEILSNIEKTGEDLKSQLKVFLKQSEKTIDSQVNCAKIEAIYGLTINKNERRKTMKEVNEVREELWGEAMNETKGDTKKAYAFYKKTCSFP